MNVQRTRIGLLLATMMLFALAMPVHGGTQAVPEITDPANDQVITGIDQTQCPAPAGCITGTQIDILAVWFTAAGTDVKISVLVSSAPAVAQQYNKYWDVSVTAGTATVVAGATFKSTAALAPTGAATAAEVTDTVLTLTVPMSAFGDAKVLTKSFATSAYAVTGADVKFISDRAPDGAAFGTDFSLAGGASNATGNQTTGNTTTTSSSTTTSPSSSGSSSTTTTGPSSTTTGSSTTSHATTSTSTSSSVDNRSASDKIQDNQTYLGASAGAAGLVLILSLIGRFGRWGA